MQISLTNRDLAQFIEEQVKAGRFPSAEALVEAAVSDLRESTADLDEQTIDAINRAEQQLDRGEGIDFDQFAAGIRRKIEAR